jgi:hypothetical protein
VFAGSGKHIPKTAERGYNRGERKLKKYCAQCAAKHDQRRSGLDDLAKVAAFQQQAGDDAGNGQHNPANACFIHDLLLRNSRAETAMKFFSD